MVDLSSAKLHLLLNLEITNSGILDKEKFDYNKLYMNRLYLFLTIVILCCACNRNNTAPSPTENTLYAIESFVGAKPDSALAILDTLPYQNLPKKERAHCACFW